MTRSDLITELIDVDKEGERDALRLVERDRASLGSPRRRARLQAPPPGCVPS